MPRDPARIDSVLTALRFYWNRNPDLRLGQIVVNMVGNRDPFYVEDDEMAGLLLNAIRVPPSDPA